jgi:hypothetical protein
MNLLIYVVEGLRKCILKLTLKQTDLNLMPIAIGTGRMTTRLSFDLILTLS